MAFIAPAIAWLIPGAGHLIQKRWIRGGILITGHNVRETLKLVDRAYLTHKGEVVYEGAAEQLVNDPKAREIYLGPEFNL